jgi:hypothetical protein
MDLPSTDSRRNMPTSRIVLQAIGLALAYPIGGCGSGTGASPITARVEVVNGIRSVRVSWPADLFTLNKGDVILEWHIWRKPGAGYNFTGVPVGAVPGSQPTYVELPAPHSVWDGIHSFLQPGTLVDSGALNTWWLASATTPATGPSGFKPGGGPYIYEVSAIVRTASISKLIPGPVVEIEFGPYDAEAISP